MEEGRETRLPDGCAHSTRRALCGVLENRNLHADLADAPNDVRDEAGFDARSRHADSKGLAEDLVEPRLRAASLDLLKKGASRSVPGPSHQS